MLRLTGGIFRGRSIQAPDNQKTRPTQAKLRQALFNSLQSFVSDTRVLDLFAGSGALGFEALSWGAKEVVFVESSRPVVKLIQKNAELLGVENRIRILAEPMESAVSRLLPMAPFDLVFADPPYSTGWETILLQQWPWGELLSPGGRFCLEWEGSKLEGKGKKGKNKEVESEQGLPEQTSLLEKVREKKYGDSVLSTYLKKDPAAYDTTDSKSNLSGIL